MRSIQRLAVCVCVIAVGQACDSRPRPAPASLRSGAPGESGSVAQPFSAAPPIGRTPPPGPAPPGMVWIPGGEFWMGCEPCGMADALPLHLVSVRGFWMDATPVTNEQFARFVRETRYVTVAERRPSADDLPGVPAEKLQAGSVVFTPPAHPVPLDDYSRWWSYVPGANWKHPEGPSSDLTGRERHPVVHVAWTDIQAYARWADKRLPTEAEFEFAARGGLDRNLYAWGNELRLRGKTPANIWQGHFPDANSGEDGYPGTSPVDAFPANGYGLHDMGGNVWQWCADWYRPDYYASFTDPNKTVADPLGPDASLDPEEPGARKRVTRGGSFLCSSEYCSRYLVGSRGKAEINSGASNLGFRLVHPAH